MSNLSKIEIQEFALWEKKAHIPHSLYSFSIELTARCNLNCRHCYINLPANDQEAKRKELSLEEIESIANQAIELGAVWVLLTGGEPLLRHDFVDIFMMLKRKGLLVSVFTNATYIRQEHLTLFMKYPPRDIETTIYGANQEIYEAVTRVKGSHKNFLRGLNSIQKAGIRIRLKAMALRSNLNEIEDIAAFGRQFTKDFYRFDPILHLRYDKDEQRNKDILYERLTPEEVVALEQADKARFEILKNNCDGYFIEAFKQRTDNHLFTCGAGSNNFTVGYDGTFRLCASLWAPGTTVNLREIRLKDAWEKFVSSIQDIRTTKESYLNACVKCPIVNLCLNCPAHAYLELGAMDEVVPYFCQVAHARSDAIQTSNQNFPE